MRKNNLSAKLGRRNGGIETTIRKNKVSCTYRDCIWQLKNAVYGSMFFEYKKAKNMHTMNETLHIFGLFIICDIEEKRPLLKKL